MSGSLLRESLCTLHKFILIMKRALTVHKLLVKDEFVSDDCKYLHPFMAAIIIIEAKEKY